jgi:hypothetical protein
VDTIEGAAFEAIYRFCNQHLKEVAGKPVGLFSTTCPDEPEWNLRIVPESHRLDGPPEEALQGVMRFMNVQYHYQLLLCCEMGRVIHVARSHYREANRQNTQVDQLRALVIQKDEIIAARDETIHHREIRSMRVII